MSILFAIYRLPKNISRQKKQATKVLTGRERVNYPHTFLGFITRQAFNTSNVETLVCPADETKMKKESDYNQKMTQSQITIT